MSVCFMAVMIGAGVRTSAGSWELNASCLFQCSWHVAGSLEAGLHETSPKTEPCQHQLFSVEYNCQLK